MAATKKTTKQQTTINNLSSNNGLKKVARFLLSCCNLCTGNVATLQVEVSSAEQFLTNGLKGCPLEWAAHPFILRMVMDIGLDRLAAHQPPTGKRNSPGRKVKQQQQPTLPHTRYELYTVWLKACVCVRPCPRVCIMYVCRPAPICFPAGFRPSSIISPPPPECWAVDR